MPWIVFDDENYRPYGPFETKAQAEEWLASQDIREPYGNQEVSLLELKDPVFNALPVIS